MDKQLKFKIYSIFIIGQGRQYRKNRLEVNGVLNLYTHMPLIKVWTLNSSTLLEHKDGSLPRGLRSRTGSLRLSCHTPHGGKDNGWGQGIEDDNARQQLRGTPCKEEVRVKPDSATMCIKLVSKVSQDPNNHLKQGFHEKRLQLTSSTVHIGSIFIHEKVILSQLKAQVRHPSISTRHGSSRYYSVWFTCY